MGVVSRGKNCERKNSPGIYTRVKKYLNWINHITRTIGKCYNKNDPGKDNDLVDKEGNWVRWLIKLQNKCGGTLVSFEKKSH